MGRPPGPIEVLLHNLVPSLSRQSNHPENKSSIQFPAVAISNPEPPEDLSTLHRTLEEAFRRGTVWTRANSSTAQATPQRHRSPISAGEEKEVKIKHFAARHLCGLEVVIYQESILRLHRNQFLVYSPSMFTALNARMVPPQRSIFAKLSIGFSSCYLQLKDDCLISDFSFQLDTAIKYSKWESEDMSFLIF